MKFKIGVTFLILACVVFLVVVGMYEPTRILRGLALREEFFRGRPTSYWREIIRADGEEGEVKTETLALFGDLNALPVLRECLSDADPNVRWPSVYLIDEAGLIHDVKRAAGEALNDSHGDVKLAGIRVLARLRREALSAVPQLIELASNQDLNISTAANCALWEIDQDEAVMGWQQFTSDKWQFTVTMPGLPEEAEKSIDTPYGPASLKLFFRSFGLASCNVGVTEYSPQVSEDFSMEERYDSAAKGVATALGGNLVRYEPIEQNGHSGREQTIEVEGRAILRTRNFLIGNRLYHVSIGFPLHTVSPKAADYLLNSLRIDYSPSK